MRNLVIAFLFILSLGICNAQTATKKPVEPAAIGVVFYLDPSSQEFKPLPDEQWKAKGKGGWATSTGLIQVAGDHSTLRIKASEKIELVFKTEHPEAVSIYAFTLKKNERQFELVKIKGTGRETIKGIPAELTKFGESSYKLTPTSPLGPGEYAVNMSGKIFTIGVD